MKPRKPVAPPPPRVPPHVSVRLSAATLARVDALAHRYTKPWRTPTRSDLVRIAILAGLDALEAAPEPSDPAGSGAGSSPHH